MLVFKKAYKNRCRLARGHRNGVLINAVLMAEKETNFMWHLKCKLVLKRPIP